MNLSTISQKCLSKRSKITETFRLYKVKTPPPNKGRREFLLRNEPSKPSKVTVREPSVPLVKVTSAILLAAKPSAGLAETRTRGGFFSTETLKPLASKK